MKDQNTTTATAYTVSEQTANIIRCLDDVDVLQRHLVDALDPLGVIEVKIEAEIMPSFYKIIEYIEKYIGQSVSVCHSIRNNTEI